MKIITTGMAAALLAAVLFFPVHAVDISAKNAVLMDAQTERVLYDKNASQRGLIASTTKIMTALVVCEQSNVLDRVKIPAEAVGVEGSSVYLREGEVLTVQDLLYCLMLHSGNDAAIALAIYCGGTVEGFVQMMNDKAAVLGLHNTHFENPHGLDSPAHYSTASDLAVLSAYALKNPVFYKTVSAKTVTAGKRSLRNHNKLLWRIEGADGVKTGFTKAAGRILVSSVTRQGRRLVAVTLCAPNDWEDHTNLINSGFSRYALKEIITAGDILGVLEVAGGSFGNVALVAGSDFLYPVAENEEIEIILQKPGFVYAPVVEGQSAGYAYVCVGGNVAGKVQIYFGETVEQAKPVKISFLRKMFGGKSE